MTHARSQGAPNTDRGRAQHGFTLIELMIVVVIVGILAAVAFPSYRNHVLRSNRSAAQAFLVDAAAREERFFSNCNTYTTNVQGNAGLCGAAGGLGYAQDTNDPNNPLYRLTIAAGDTGDIATSFRLTATAINGQLDDDQCRTFTLDNLGQRGSTNSAGAANPGPPNDPCWP